MSKKLSLTCRSHPTSQKNSEEIMPSLKTTVKIGEKSDQEDIQNRVIIKHNLNKKNYVELLLIPCEEKEFTFSKKVVDFQDCSQTNKAAVM